MYGSIRFSGKDVPGQRLKFDRLAVGDKRDLLLLSVVAETNIIKMIRAAITGGVKVSIDFDGVLIQRPGSHVMGGGYSSATLSAVEEGYDCHTHRLEHGLVHAMFSARTPGFMRNVSDAALWEELNSTRFTTPILPAWLPFIKSQFLRSGHLAMAFCHNCNSGKLIATDAELDKVVSDGLSERALLIPSASPTVVPAACI